MNTRAIGPQSSSKLYESAAALVAAIRDAGGVETAVQRLGAPEGTIEDLQDMNPLRVCSWRRVVCGSQGLLQIAMEGADGAVPPQIMEVRNLRGVASFGGPYAASAGDFPFPQLERDPTVRNALWGACAPGEWAQWAV
jgi:hypothetical protein